MSPLPELAIRRVQIQNYKSIAACNVELGRLSILVGRNGIGKSNFLDALSFVADSLNYSLDHALRTRGGINDVRRRSSERPTHFSIRIEVVLPGGQVGSYGFKIGAKSGGGFEVTNEECSIAAPGHLDQSFYKIRKKKLTHHSLATAPAHTNDRLYLVLLSGDPEFRPLYDALSRITHYNIVPDRIREFKPASEGHILAKEGSNLAAVLAQIDGPTKERILLFLATVVPGIKSIARKALGGAETIEFQQTSDEEHKPQKFLANSMSDGTLRALGILVALFQGDSKRAPSIPIVAIEEPEAALHPAAAGVLCDALREASERRQVIVTSHSPDLLDRPSLTAEDLLAVNTQAGATVIAPIDETGRLAIRDELMTAGDLLRNDQIKVDREVLSQQDLKLF